MSGNSGMTDRLERRIRWEYKQPFARSPLRHRLRSGLSARHRERQIRRVAIVGATLDAFIGATERAIMTLEELMERVRTSNRVVIELGCGEKKRPGAIGLDRLPLPGVDYVVDLETGLDFLPADSVDEFHSKHVLEHIANFEPLMRGIHRALKPDGIKVAVVPHFSNPYYYSDYTHKRFFGLYTFDYLAERDRRYRRTVPSFYTDFKFRVVSRKLKFRSPFWLRDKVKSLEKRIFNFNPYMQELYEGSLCFWFPCHEVEFVLAPVK
jgi:predicted SAM-dependent methyltransferase